MPSTEYDRDVKMASSPGSSDLSSVVSEDEDDQASMADISSRPSVDHTHDHPHPAKRRKTGNNTSLNVSYERASSSQPEPEDDIISVSEDSWGSAPGSPTHDEYTVRDEAQTECLWKDCDYGRAQNNDDLVNHVQSTHCATGGPKKSKYVCEWGECQNKKANVHPSNYALKAHCRSHTKEKPYYCALPECDKAFTRSDALAKHMRTVHEPEPAKGAGPNTAAFLEPPAIAKKPQVKAANGVTTRAQPTVAYDEKGQEMDPSSPNDNITYIPAHHPLTGQPGFMIHYPPDVHFSSWESTIRADELMHVLRHQLRWAEDEGKALEQENAELERIRREEWTLKELLLDGLATTEQARAGRVKPTRRLQPKVHETLEVVPEVEQAPKRKRPAAARRSRAKDAVKTEPVETTPAQATTPVADTDVYGEQPETSPPPTGASGGFDGDDDPYDNYVQGLIKRMQERRAGTGEDDEVSTKAAS